MNKLKMHSPDLTQANIDKLAELFPNCLTETRGADGEVKRSIDFDQLRQELSTSIVEGPQERYQLNWPGKREALLTANAPIAKTLRPCREESVDFDTTQNLFIEGDNLDALKLLQETYLNKVKVIYIDPPYNTGNDFIYEDDFAVDSETYKVRSNQKDEFGSRLTANTESNGRFHSDWLSMMYSRITLARNLLRDDGVIFISIDDTEVANLRLLCNQVFGQENFLVNAIWQKRYGVSSDAKGIPGMHDHILIYQKSGAFVPGLLPRTEKQDAVYKNLDGDPRGLWRSDNLTRTEFRARDYYPITSPKTREEFYPPKGSSWRHPRDEMERLIADNRIWFGLDGTNRPAAKRFLSEVKQGVVASGWWPFSEVGHTDESKKELQALFDDVSPFDTPKPTRLIRRMLDIGLNCENSIVMDFFAGSGSTAHAVMARNADKNSTDRYILVQLPEPLSPDNKTQKLAVDCCDALGKPRNIAEITKERLRRAGAAVSQVKGELIGGLDTGFRVLKIDTSNMKEVFYTPDAVSQDLLSDQVNNIREDRTSEDLLFQVLLDWGVDLALPITQETIAGKVVYFVDGNALVACFEEGVSEDFVKLLAKREPLRVVFRDAGFASDSVKINVEQIFKLMSPSTEVKCI